MQNMKLIEELFLKLHMAHGKKFLEFFNNDRDFIAASKIFWCNELECVTQEQLKSAIKSCFNEFSDIPTLIQFKKLCLRKPEPLPDYFSPCLPAPIEPEISHEGRKKIREMLESCKGKILKSMDDI